MVFRSQWNMFCCRMRFSPRAIRSLELEIFFKEIVFFAVQPVKTRLSFLRNMTDMLEFGYSECIKLWKQWLQSLREGGIFFFNVEEIVIKYHNLLLKGNFSLLLKKWLKNLRIGLPLLSGSIGNSGWTFPDNFNWTVLNSSFGVSPFFRTILHINIRSPISWVPLTKLSNFTAIAHQRELSSWARAIFWSGPHTRDTGRS